MDKHHRASPTELPKEKVLALLSDKLNCSIESLSFIFDRPETHDINTYNIEIPNLKDY